MEKSGVVGQFDTVLKGHGFSRAVRVAAATKMKGSLQIAEKLRQRAVL
jgi:hypothetical protein